MGYILDLRKKIGKAPIIMTSACVLIVNPKGELLLQKRTDNGAWGYPGGSMELGESFEECARREALEETGLNCLELQYFAHSAGKDYHYFYPNGDEAYVAEIVFLCTKYEGELKVQKSEASEQRFFDLNDLPENISPLNREVIGLLKQRAGAPAAFGQSD